jgi:hypothetical protein
VRTRLQAAGLVVAIGLVAVAVNLWPPRARAQLARPGEDPRPMASRIVDPLPLPVTGEVRLVASTPLLVQLANAPATSAPPFVAQGRCYYIDLDGGTRWRELLWHVNDVQGGWVHVRPARASSRPSVGLDAGWINLARAARISDELRCE